jgi:hypothetical protein
MGEAKRRGSNRRDKTFPPVAISDTPGEHRHVPGTITIHVLHSSGASLSSTLALDDVEEAIDIGRRTVKKTGLSLDEARKEARSWVAGQFDADNRHLQQPTATHIAVSALWLACTAPNRQGEMIQECIKTDAVVALLITEHTVHGRRAINGRTVAASPDATLAEIVQMLGMGPGMEAVTGQLAPH